MGLDAVLRARQMCLHAEVSIDPSLRVERDSKIYGLKAMAKMEVVGFGQSAACFRSVGLGGLEP
jgi:hypothetical protein